MSDTLTAEEREALLTRCQHLVDGYYVRMRALQAGAVLPPGETPTLPQQVASDMGAILRLARLATPELIQLGEAAVKYAVTKRDEGEPAGFYLNRLEAAKLDIFEAARTYAASRDGGGGT